MNIKYMLYVFQIIKSLIKNILTIIEFIIKKKCTFETKYPIEFII